LPGLGEARLAIMRLNLISYEACPTPVRLDLTISSKAKPRWWLGLPPMSSLDQLLATGDNTSKQRGTATVGWQSMKKKKREEKEKMEEEELDLILRFVPGTRINFSFIIDSVPNLLSRTKKK